MLQLAIKANLPLVAVRTRDVLNLPDIIEHLTGKLPRWLDKSNMTPTALQENPIRLFVSVKGQVDYQDFYKKFMSNGATLVVINPPTIDDAMFDAGEAPVPHDMVTMFLNEVVQDHERAEILSRCFGGCTLKEVAEIARLAMARYKALDVKGLTATRKEVFQGQKGLQQVDTQQALYEPLESLAAWVKKEKKFFLDPKTDYRLVPRGLLFTGPPGTGKSAGSKWVAEQLGVPLFRFDIGSTKGKYVGESEAAMMTNLARLDREAPCVVLLDEIEKIFANSGHSGDSDTTTSMLSQLLWWLAEHRSRVLTIMTTNNEKILPPELYREGRINKVVEFNGLNDEDAEGLIVGILKTFGYTNADCLKHCLAITKSIWKNTPPSNIIAHAKITEFTYEYVKNTM